MAERTFLGVIGGSGLYELEGLAKVKVHSLVTPFGKPSDPIVTGEFAGRPVAFLSRHGKGHRHLPSEVNYRANIYALKSLGVTHVLSMSAVGSLREECAPGHVVIPDQIFDRTLGLRSRTFFGNGIVGHVPFGDPYCPELRALARAASEGVGIPTHFGGALVVIEGPRFSSRSESQAFRGMTANATIIGMTAMPEAALAREAGLAYCTVGLVTDYDCWREHEEAVDVSAVVAVLQKNVENSKRVVAKLLEALPVESDNPLFDAARYAIMTSEECIPFETKRDLRLLFGKYWKS